MRRSGRQLTPLGQGGIAVLFEDIAAVEVPVVVEVVVDRGVGGGKLLESVMSLTFAIARSRRRNCWWEFSARLLSQRPQIWTAALPIRFIAARYDRSRSVTIGRGRP